MEVVNLWVAQTSYEKCTGSYLGKKDFPGSAWESLSSKEKRYYRCYFNVHLDGKLKSKSPLPVDEELLAAQNAKYKNKKEKRMELARAIVNSKVFCKSSAECKKAFALSQVFINEHATMKIQIATDAIVETYNITGESGVAMKVIKKPGKGMTEEISLAISCKPQKTNRCHNKKVFLYSQYPQYINQNLK